jgi:hypothetical protein
MPGILEDLLWCAALAAWLMFLLAFLGEGLRPFARNIRRLAEQVFRMKVNR